MSDDALQAKADTARAEWNDEDDLRRGLKRLASGGVWLPHEQYEELRADRDRLAARLAEALSQLARCLEFAEEGWAYAADYFKEKWGYEDEMAWYRSFLARDVLGENSE